MRDVESERKCLVLEGVTESGAENSSFSFLNSLSVGDRSTGCRVTNLVGVTNPAVALGNYTKPPGGGHTNPLNRETVLLK